METEYNNIKWTKKDQEKVDNILDQAKFYIRLFLIGFGSGVIVFILIKIIKIWLLSASIGGVLI